MTKKLIEKSKPESLTVVRRKPPSLKVKVDENDRVEVEIDGDFDRILKEVTNKSVALGLVGQIVALGSQGKRLDERAANFSIGFVDAMQPKDAAEALLLAQMAATHQAAMMMARRLNHVENIPQQDAAERAMNKLARTFTAQLDTLKRYRSKGQTVRVERVNVESGGQAIVGNVNSPKRSG